LQTGSIGYGNNLLEIVQIFYSKTQKIFLKKDKKIVTNEILWQITSE